MVYRLIGGGVDMILLSGIINIMNFILLVVVIVLFIKLIPLISKRFFDAFRWFLIAFAFFGLKFIIDILYSFDIFILTKENMILIRDIFCLLIMLSFLISFRALYKIFFMALDGKIKNGKLKKEIELRQSLRKEIYRRLREKLREKEK